MKTLFFRLYVLGWIFASMNFSGLAVAETSSRPERWDQFRCQFLNNVTLEQLKTKLLETCNVDKPFTVSTSGITSNYTYCCSLKGDDQQAVKEVGKK